MIHNVFHSITEMLSDKEYVIVISMVYIRSFYPIRRHVAITDALVGLDMPGSTFN